MQKGRLIDHRQEGPPWILPPFEFTEPAGGTVTLRSGYIVSGIQLFVHFGVFVYSSRKPV